MILILCADYRKRTLAKFDTLEEEIKTLRASLEDYRDTFELVLRIAFPSEPVGGTPTARLETLRMAPQKLKDHVKEIATTSAVQALALVKSHYPRVDLQRVGEGFAADTDDDKSEAWLSDVKPTSELLVSHLNMEPL